MVIKNFELFEHIKCVFNESESQYLVIFHDDDVLERDYLKIVLDTILDQPITTEHKMGISYEVNNVLQQKIFNKI